MNRKGIPLKETTATRPKLSGRKRLQALRELEAPLQPAAPQPPDWRSAQNGGTLGRPLGFVCLFARLLACLFVCLFVC